MNHQLGKESSEEILPLETIDDNLESNDQLYDRHSQAEALIKCYQRRVTSKPSSAELALLNGGSGSGKTSLAQAFGKQVHLGLSAQTPALFLQGKCPIKSTNGCSDGMPYAPFTQAFEQLADQILALEADDREYIQEMMQVVVGSEVPLLVEILPCFQRVLGLNDGMDVSEISEESSTTHKLTKTIALDQQVQFAAVLRRCMRALCCKRNVVLFLDDIQWASQPTLDLINSLASPSMDNNQGLMILGACRGNEVAPQDALSTMLRSLEAKGTRITEIAVPNLTLDAVTTFIRDTATNLPREQCSLIATTALQKTNGNPFDVRQYLCRLEESRALYMDANDGVWVYDETVAAEEASIAAKPKVRHDNGGTSNGLEYLVERMAELPLEIQEVLMASACLGGDCIREVFLVWALIDDEDKPHPRKDQVQRALRVGVTRGILKQFDWESGTGQFGHDKFAEAAFGLIPTHQRASFQLRLGRNLQKNAQDIVGIPKALPTFVSLILSGKTEIHCQDERDALASLCLEAGRLLAQSSAFGTAMEHAIHGIGLLSETHWQDQYKLSLSLYNAAAELAYCNGNHEAVDQYVCEVKDHAQCMEDGLQADTTQILSLGSRGMHDRAGALGVHTLRQMGEAVPSKVSRAHALLEIYKAKRQLRGRSDEEILGLPKIQTGHPALKIMSLLHVLYPIALMSHIEYTVLIACRLICLTLQHGLCSYSSVGFAFFGSTLARTGNVEEGCRFGELSLRMHPTKELMARSLLRVGLNLRSYKEPLRTNITTLLEANRLGMRSGDIETAMYAVFAACGSRFYAGEPLHVVARISSHLFQQCQEYRQHAGMFVLPLQQCCLNLMGKAAGDPMVLTGEAMDEAKLMGQARAEHNMGLTSFVLLIKFILATYLNELAQAELLSEQLRQIINRKHPPFIPIIWTIHHFFEGLVAVALANNAPSLLSKHHELRVARRRLQTIRDASARCPENMMNKVHLIEADLEVVCKGNLDQAESKYRQSIVFAEHEGFLPEQALACEKLARMLLVRHIATNNSKSSTYLARAESYFLQARCLYEKYGAVILVDRIERELESLRARGSLASSKVFVEHRRKDDKEHRRAIRKSFTHGCLVPKLTEEDFKMGCC